MKVDCVRCKRWKQVLLCECCEMFCEPCFDNHTPKCRELNKDIPRFDGRPMLWWVEDGVEFGFEIRHGSGPTHKHEYYLREKNEWAEGEGEMTAKECIENGDLFLGYL